MGHIYFMTGFPGFISYQLIKELIRQDHSLDKCYLLVLPDQKFRAEAEVAEIRRSMPGCAVDFELITGDITKDRLDVPADKQEWLKSNITHVFHLAAIYDLAVEEKTAELVNVSGTAHVNRFVKTLTKIKRYLYFSTAYVAGTREGILYEHELMKPPSFKNHYERTKYEAELLVESLKKEGIPVTIIRPGIVKGHSQTGETIKFDGPYFILNFLDKLRFLPVYPYIGRLNECVVNLVPVDYIIQAAAFLALYEDGAGKTYHLTDPSPYTAHEIYKLFVEELYHKKPRGRVPMGLSRLGLAVKPIRVYLGIEKEALDYFTWRGTFDSTQSQKDLAVQGIRCPDFKDGVPAMVDFYLKHKHEQAYQIAIK